MSQALALITNADDNHRLESLLHRATVVEIGTLLPYGELRNATGLNPGTALYHLVFKANRVLLPGKRMLVNRRGMGYAVATAQAQIAHADGRRQRGTRQFKHAFAELQHTDTTQLSAAERQQFDQNLALAAMRLQSARRRTLLAREYSRKAIAQDDEILKELAAAEKAIQAVWKRIR